LLDAGGLPPADIAANLRDLERINTWLGGARAVLAHTRRILREGTGPVSVLDIACGGGDLLRRLASQAHKCGRDLAGVGLDRNQTVLDYARAHSAHLPGLSWVRGDARQLPFAPRSFDLVLCSTFLHHLPPVAAGTFLQQAAALSRDWLVVTDVVRSSLAYAAFVAFAGLLGAHPVTHCDGAVSLRRAYLPAELTGMATQAGLAEWRVHRHSFARMTLVGRVAPEGSSPCACC